MSYQFVDCRWELGKPGRGQEFYLAGHIPGASFLDVERDLSSPPGPGGRHPLPSEEQFAEAAGLQAHRGAGDALANRELPDRCAPYQIATAGVRR